MIIQPFREQNCISCPKLVGVNPLQTPLAKHQDNAERDWFATNYSYFEYIFTNILDPKDIFNDKSLPSLTQLYVLDCQLELTLINR